jgi:hypothetical protein
VPQNDNFADAVPIGLGEAIAGTTRDATRELGEPRHGTEGVHTVWFRFSVETGRVVRLDACDRGQPPRMAVYTGRRVNRLTRVAGIDNCFVQFAAQPGTIYRVVVVDPGQGLPFRLTTRGATPPANDHFADATDIALESTTPATTRDSTRERGEPVAFTKFPHTVWFHLILPEGMTVELTACPSPESLIAVFTGPGLEQLTRVGALNCAIRVGATQTVPLFIQVSSRRDADFNLVSRAVTMSP